MLSGEVTNRVKRQPLSVRARSCCCLGFWAESEKIKTSVAEVGGGGKNTRGNSNPRNLSVLPMRSAGKETAGLDPQAAPHLQKVPDFNPGMVDVSRIRAWLFKLHKGFCVQLSFVKPLLNI